METIYHTENSKKVETFINDLKNNNSVLEVAKFFKKTVLEICKLIEKFIEILYYKTGQIKEIKLNFLETQSNLKMVQNVKF